MTRLVIHIGLEYVDRGAVCEDLQQWREPLAAAGVAVPPGDPMTDWRAFVEGLLNRTPSDSALRTLASTTESGADLLLVSSEPAADLLTSPERISRLREVADDAGMTPHVVAIVREQIGYINELYCHRVMTLDSARSFRRFATTPVPAHRFDYAAALGELADGDEVPLTVLSYPETTDIGPTRAVLRAAGVTADVVSGLPESTYRPSPLPGPVLVAATRILQKNLAHHKVIEEYGRFALAGAVDRLRDHALEHAWDDETFWGWDEQLQRTFEQELGPGNDVLAAAVWDGPFPEPWSTATPNRVDLPTLEPRLLRDLLQVVNEISGEYVARLSGAAQNASGG